MLAAQILAFKHEREILGWFYNNLGSKGQVVVEELAAVTIRDAIRWAEAFQGETSERVPRRPLCDRAPAQGRLPAQEARGHHLVRVRGQRGRTRSASSAPATRSTRSTSMSVFNQAFSELNKESHKLVILLYLYGYPYAEIAEKVTSQLAGSGDDPMSENNVSQIISRFNKRLDELLDDD